MKPQTVLHRHRNRMIHCLKDISPDSQGCPALQRFCEEIADDLDQVTDTPAKRDYLPGEEMFLWCHAELTEIGEIARPIKPPQGYIADMLARLRDFGERLERNEPLPPGFAIHWLSDDDVLDEFDDAAR